MTLDATILSGSSRRQAAVALITATAMQAFDATIANVALPQLEQNLGGGVDLGSWVMTSYLCAAAVMATLTGWLRRRYGARQLFAGSIGLFVFASLLCSIAPSPATLIQFRLMQGTAAGIIQPLSQAIPYCLTGECSPDFKRCLTARVPVASLISARATAPLPNPKSMLVDVGPVELWATRYTPTHPPARPDDCRHRLDARQMLG